MGALAERTRQQGLDVRLSVDLCPQNQASGRLAREIETATYRIAQEALTNARKHGGATHVNVDLWEDDSNIHLTVQDDGQGFDPTAKGQGSGSSASASAWTSPRRVRGQLGAWQGHHTERHGAEPARGTWRRPFRVSP